MALVKLDRAAALTGKSRSTIHRAMAAGKLSFSRDEHGERVVDVAELDRVYEVRASGDTVPSDTVRPSTQPTDSLAALRDTARLEADLAAAKTRISDLERDRDRWHELATVTLRQLADQRPAASMPRPGFWARVFG